MTLRRHCTVIMWLTSRLTNTSTNSAPMSSPNINTIQPTCGAPGRRHVSSRPRACVRLERGFHKAEIKSKLTRLQLSSSSIRRTRSFPTTSFRTLPRELRQQILLDTFDASQHLPVLNTYTKTARMDELTRWVAVLRTVDDQFTEDVNFVARKWSESSKIV